MIDLVEDFQEILIELADADADFVVIGGYAVAFHGHPRGTKDLDVLVRATPSNATRVYRALAAFGAPLEQFDVQESDFSDYDGVLQIGLPPRRIDILNKAAAITFDEAIEDNLSMHVQGRRVPFIGLKALSKHKLAAGRKQDLADVAALSKITRSPKNE